MFIQICLLCFWSLTAARCSCFCDAPLTSVVCDAQTFFPCVSLSGSYRIVSCLCITRAWMTHCYQQPLNAFARKAQTRFPTLAAVAWISPSVGGACRRFMGSLNQPRVSWSWQEVNWEVLISPTSCLPSPAGGGDSDKLWQAGKTASSSSSSRERREINKSSLRPQLFLRCFFISFRRPDGDYSLLFVLRCSDDISTLCAEWCIIQKWPSNGQVETKYGFRWMKNLTASTPLTAWNIL